LGNMLWQAFQNPDSPQGNNNFYFFRSLIDDIYKYQRKKNVVNILHLIDKNNLIYKL